MRVFISTPVRGNVEENLKLAQMITLWFLKKGYAPVCPHCVALTVGLDDSDEYERQIGMDYAFELLPTCHKMLVVYRKDGTLSSGCQAEVTAAPYLPKYFVTWDAAERMFSDESSQT